MVNYTQEDQEYYVNTYPDHIGNAAPAMASRQSMLSGRIGEVFQFFFIKIKTFRNLLFDTWEILYTDKLEQIYKYVKIMFTFIFQAIITGFSKLHISR